MKSKGNYKKATRYLLKVNHIVNDVNLPAYGEVGVDILASATPIDTGKTANSWAYVVKRDRDTIQLHFINTNSPNGCPIAIIYQYGHGTGTGGWVEGEDYINPAIQPLFDKIIADIEKEVTRL